MSLNKAFLIILDGWGHGKVEKVDALKLANTPTMDSLYSDFPNAELITFGQEVGLPDGQMGNSEVGHLNIGAGRVVFQALARINNEIEENRFKSNPILVEALEYAQTKAKKVHILGLLSDGGVHSHINHITELANACNEKVLETYIHAFLDGRDTAPNNGIKYIQQLEKDLEGSSTQIGTILGRYFAMDRDNRWERIKVAYDLLVHNKAEYKGEASKFISLQYEDDITDEFMKAILVNDSKIEEGDVVLFANFRTDRPRELTQVLCQEDHLDHEMSKMNLHFVTMTNYNENYKGIKVMYEKDDIKNTIGEVLSNANCTQLRIAETEKYPHVTFFLNGGKESLFNGEERIVVPSPKVATYDLKPEMSAYEVKDKVIEAIKEKTPDFICLNFANTDMVGHTGSLEAAMKSAEAVDKCLSEIIPIAKSEEYNIVVIADHGNADIMSNPDGSVHTAHTTNMVPIIVIANQNSLEVENGKLADIAPTLLKLMNIPIPEEMTGKVLLKH